MVKVVAGFPVVEDFITVLNGRESSSGKIGYGEDNKSTKRRE